MAAAPPAYVRTIFDIETVRNLCAATSGSAARCENVLKINAIVKLDSIRCGEWNKFQDPLLIFETHIGQRKPEE
ncbi:MAG TPA: hypothetical protein VJT69_01660 [Pyrinomonadaceae bacterium]|nr:hypothetical protein [Pyrinomonadaceae bacterium]